MGGKFAPAHRDETTGTLDDGFHTDLLEDNFEEVDDVLRGGKALSPREIVEKAQRYSRHLNARRFVNRAGDDEDIAQEAILRLHERSVKTGVPINSSFVHTIVRRVIFEDVARELKVGNPPTVTALGLLGTAASDLEQKLKRTLTNKEFDAIGEKIRDEWSDRDHMPRKDFWLDSNHRPTSAFRPLGADEDGEARSNFPTAKAPSAEDTFTEQYDADTDRDEQLWAAADDLDSTSSVDRKNRAWDVYSKAMNLPAVQARSVAMRAVTAHRGVVLGRVASLAQAHLDGTIEAGESTAFFAAWGGVDTLGEDSADRLAEAFTRNPVHAENLWRAALANANVRQPMRIRASEQVPA